jgi:hypothetical protein
VRFPDEILKATAFLGVDLGSQIVYGGTAFIVGVPLEPRFPDSYSMALITARHCIEDTRQYGNLWVRLNLAEGGSQLYQVNHDNWHFHPDPSVDIAVLPVHLPAECDFKFYPPNTFLTDADVEERALGIGDELCMAGLFRHRPGTDQNVPIGRSGVIAAMPGELLATSSGAPYQAYLAEMRSIGGLSGSPVFVIFPSDRLLIGEHHDPAIYALGIVRGHWDTQGYISVTSRTPAAEAEIFNSGIATVTPIQRAAEVLDAASLVAMRAAQADAWEIQQAGGKSEDKDPNITDLEDAPRQAERPALAWPRGSG